MSGRHIFDLEDGETDTDRIEQALSWIAGLEKKRCSLHERVFEAARAAEDALERFRKMTHRPAPCGTCSGRGWVQKIEIGPGWGNATTSKCASCSGSGRGQVKVGP